MPCARESIEGLSPNSMRACDQPQFMFKKLINENP